MRTSRDAFRCLARQQSSPSTRARGRPQDRDRGQGVVMRSPWQGLTVGVAEQQRLRPASSESWMGSSPCRRRRTNVSRLLSVGQSSAVCHLVFFSPAIPADHGTLSRAASIRSKLSYIDPNCPLPARRLHHRTARVSSSLDQLKMRTGRTWGSQVWHISLRCQQHSHNSSMPLTCRNKPSPISLLTSPSSPCFPYSLSSVDSS